MLVKFNNHYLENIFDNKPVIGKPKYTSDVIVKFKKTIIMLRYIDNIRELRKYRGLNFEALKGDLKGFYSVRVDKKYRLIISLENDVISIADIIIIEDLSNHYQ